jgi:pimeloyl-ACP methyl ester carboxylesterase
VRTRRARFGGKARGDRGTSGRFVSLVILVVFGVTVPVVRGTAREAATRPAVFEAGSCPGELAGHPRITCGVLRVSDAADGHGWANTRLAVAVIHASAPTPKPDPIVFIHGGPGGEIVREAADVFESSGLDADRDVIVMDERGGGLSTPLLTCPEVDRVDMNAWLARAENDPVALAAQRRARSQCEQRLIRQGDNPAAVNTAAIADDFAALRRGLHITKWNVLGFSYGGKVALALLRADPAGIRSMLLDAPAPPDKSLFDPIRARSALSTLFSACSASPGCSSRHPNLRADWVARRQALDTTPVSVPVPASSDHPATTVLIDGNRATEAVIGGLSDPSTIPMLPDLLTAPDAPTLAAQNLAAPLPSGFPLAANLAVACREDLPLRPHGSPDPLTGNPTTSGLWHLCDGWRAKPAPPAERRVAVTRVPTLILHGQFDPAVPDQWVSQLARKLHARLIRFPGRSHGVVRGDDPCSISVATQFFAAPTGIPETSCITPMTLP